MEAWTGKRLEEEAPMDHPGENARAQELAERCGVRYEQVVEWLSEQYTLAEIERACRVAQEKHAEPGDVLAMRAAGLDWRAIDRALRAVPDTDDEDDEDAY